MTSGNRCISDGMTTVSHSSFIDFIHRRDRHLNEWEMIELMVNQVNLRLPVVDCAALSRQNEIEEWTDHSLIYLDQLCCCGYCC